jgi:hypothetical protein
MRVPEYKSMYALRPTQVEGAWSNWAWARKRYLEATDVEAAERCLEDMLSYVSEQNPPLAVPAPRHHGLWILTYGWLSLLMLTGSLFAAGLPNPGTFSAGWAGVLTVWVVVLWANKDL